MYVILYGYGCNLKLKYMEIYGFVLAMDLNVCMWLEFWMNICNGYYGQWMKWLSWYMEGHCLRNWNKIVGLNDWIEMFCDVYEMKASIAIWSCDEYG